MKGEKPTTDTILYELMSEELHGLLRNRRLPTAGLKQDLVASLAESRWKVM